MSATRKSTRIIKKSRVNVKLDATNDIEFVDANEVVEAEAWTADIIDGVEEEVVEELVENPDGTMSIKMISKLDMNGTEKDAFRLDCPKCGLSFPSAEVILANAIQEDKGINFQ